MVGNLALGQDACEAEHAERADGGRRGSAELAVRRALPEVDPKIMS